MNNSVQFCTKCGTENAIDASFCAKCGNKLVSVRPSVEEANGGDTEATTPNSDPSVSQYATVVRRMNYPKASLGSRFLAHIVDNLIVGLPLIPGALLMNGRSTEGLGVFLMIVAGIWSIFYGVCKDGFAGGQSYGKRLNGLMVVNLTTNKPCTKGKSFLRSLSFAIPYIGGIVELVMVFANDKGRRLGDMFAGSQVIEVSQYRQ